MKKNSEKKWKIFGIVSAALVFVLLVLFIYLAFVKVEVLKTPVPVVNPEAGLGQEGAECGGELKLPCLPGLGCLMTNEVQRSGVCIKLTDEDPGPTRPGSEL